MKKMDGLRRHSGIGLMNIFSRQQLTDEVYAASYRATRLLSYRVLYSARIGFK